MVFLVFCKIFVPRSEGPPLTVYLYTCNENDKKNVTDFVAVFCPGYV